MPASTVWAVADIGSRPDNDSVVLNHVKRSGMWRANCSCGRSCMTRDNMDKTGNVCRNHAVFHLEPRAGTHDQTIVEKS